MKALSHCQTNVAQRVNNNNPAGARLLPEVNMENEKPTSDPIPKPQPPVRDDGGKAADKESPETAFATPTEPLKKKRD